MFSQHLSETRKNQACQNQGSVFNIIVTAVKTVNITWNQREKRRTSLGQVWGEETGPTSFCHPRRLEVPTCFHFRGPAETWCPNQGSWEPRGRAWGLRGSHPIHVDQDPVPGDYISALYLCVLSPLRLTTSELRVLPD